MRKLLLGERVYIFPKNGAIGTYKGISVHKKTGKKTCLVSFSGPKGDEILYMRPDEIEPVKAVIGDDVHIFIRVSFDENHVMKGKITDMILGGVERKYVITITYPPQNPDTGTITLSRNQFRLLFEM